MSRIILLSKSKIKDHQKCSRMLWHELNHPKEKVWDSQNQFLFDQGREVESIARSQFPNALLQDKIANEDKLVMTEKWIAGENKHLPMFEAAFFAKKTIIQFDVLVPTDEPNVFDAIEVKSSASFKEDYRLDVLCQYWIATYSGVKIRNFELWYINKGKDKDDDSQNYFTKENITKFVQENENYFISEHSKALATALKKDEMPAICRSSLCEDCPFAQTKECKMEISKTSILALPNFKNKYKFYNQGETDILTMDQDLLEKVNPIVLSAITKNELVINKEGLVNEFSEWVFPLNFFDFETLQAAIPILKGQRPYQQKVIQYSNHFLDNINDDLLTHNVFLHEKLNESPDEACIQAMIESLGKNRGSIVSYNKTFEETRIKELIKEYPQYTEPLTRIVERFVDLMHLVKKYVYHPDFMGSYSLKVVSPVLLKEYGSYSDSVIKSGSSIAQYYSEMLLTKDENRRLEIKNALLKYCQYDTLNLFLVLRFLLNQSTDLGKLVRLNLGIDIPNSEKG